MEEFCGAVEDEEDVVARSAGELSEHGLWVDGDGVVGADGAVE